MSKQTEKIKALVEKRELARLGGWPEGYRQAA